MSGIQVMISAGETSGDGLAAQLVTALKSLLTPFEPRFFGAGGPAMCAAGVEVTHDLTRHAMIGIPSWSEYRQFRRWRDELAALARERQPELFIGTDFFAFNSRLAESIRSSATQRRGDFNNWRPQLVQYVSPQVWASRPGRANRLSATYDLLLSILPFEKDWYSSRVPQLPVHFVGHPLVDRYADIDVRSKSRPKPSAMINPNPPIVLLLPGSRLGELKQHWPIVAHTAQIVAKSRPVQFLLVSPHADFTAFFAPLAASIPHLTIQVGELQRALQSATLALACTGTVTLECAWFGVPHVAFYKTNRITYELGKRIVTVPYLAMPNLLANRRLVPEWIQDEANPEQLASSVLSLLNDTNRLDDMREELVQITGSLGSPGAAQRGAQAIIAMLQTLRVAPMTQLRQN